MIGSGMFGLSQDGKNYPKPNKALLQNYWLKSKLTLPTLTYPNLTCVTLPKLTSIHVHFWGSIQFGMLAQFLP
jgi:hypothetical protein